MAFFDWFEKEYGLSAEEFEKYAELAIAQGKEFRDFEEFVNWINEVSKKIREELREYEVLETQR